MNAIVAVLGLVLFPAQAEPTAECRVALAFIQTLAAEAGPKPVVFSDENEFLPIIPTERTWFDAGGKGVPAPAAELVGRVRTRSAIKACPSVRAWLDREGIGHGKRAVDAVIDGLRLQEGYPAMILGVSLPALSADGAEAVLITSGASAPLSGGGMIQHLRRTPEGAWTKVSAIGLYVS